MPRALILGGAGLIGRATASRLLAAGWTVTVAGHSPPQDPSAPPSAGATFVDAERDDVAALQRAIGAGVDLLVDCLCFTAGHAEQLRALAAEAGSTVMISSKAVYVDAHGRHVNSPERPWFPDPITEDQATVRPGGSDFRSREGYGANKVSAEQVLLDSGLPVTILRPSKVHGPGARPAREWYFVKRVLDQRPVVLLAARGTGADHPSAAANIASLIELAAAHPGQRVLNAADPDNPTGRDIAITIAAVLNHQWREVLLDASAPAGLGRHPWHAIPPITLDTSAAARILGYRPVGDYAATVRAELAWLLDHCAIRDGRAELPAELYHFSHEHAFDYPSEDSYLDQVR